jgi:LacI family transcriptional regulator
MVTQAEIASKLGVSRQLATSALGGYPQVSEESRKRITAAALEMGYHPNPHARALHCKKTGIVARSIPPRCSTSSGSWRKTRRVGQAVAAASLPKARKQPT